ncbi:MAG: PEGA domain-containing protein [Planctomycetes bacterium]|nr:PEGA domain-containing protein [Planctomycetota bacterium]
MADHQPDPKGTATFWLSSGQKSVQASAKPPSASSLGTAAAWPRIFFPVLLLLVMGGFLVGASARGRIDLFTAFRPDLKVTTEPVKGASVFVNGHLAGATPVKITGLPAGEYVVRIERDGYQTAVRRVNLEGRGAEVNETLAELPSGKLRVQIEPTGAEVLLDGELVGHTPLSLDKVTSGQHELVVRKTNFDAFVQTITVSPGEPVEYKDFELRDKILVMLRRNIEAEPQRVSHYVDLGHYLFVTDDLEESAKTYAKALSVAAEPLKLADDVPAPERDLEFRLRSEDTQRMNDEIRKKENWPGKDVALFKAKIEEAQDQVAREHIDNWGWVKQAGDGFLRRQKYERAEDLYVRHLDAVAKGGDRATPLQELLSIRLRMHNLSGARDTFAKYLEASVKRPDLMRQCAHDVFVQHGAFRDAERTEVLSMAEKLSRTAYNDCPKGDLKSLCAFELAQTLKTLDRFDAAAPLFKEAADTAADEPTKEQRLLDQAACLLRIPDLAQARAVYEALAKSPRENIRNAAAQGIKTIEAREAKAAKTPTKK